MTFIPHFANSIQQVVSMIGSSSRHPLDASSRKNGSPWVSVPPTFPESSHSEPPLEGRKVGHVALRLDKELNPQPAYGALLKALKGQ